MHVKELMPLCRVLQSTEFPLTWNIREILGIEEVRNSWVILLVVRKK